MSFPERIQSIKKADKVLDIFGQGFEFNEKINYTIHDDQESFFEVINTEGVRFNIKWYKDFIYYVKRVTYQFNKNIFKQKLYSRFGITLK